MMALQPGVLESLQTVFADIVRCFCLNTLIMNETEDYEQAFTAADPEYLSPDQGLTAQWAAHDYSHRAGHIQ